MDTAITIRAVVSGAVQSRECGLQLGRDLLQGFGGSTLSAVLVFASIEHDQGALLEGVRAAVGPAVGLLGCSTQGLMGKGTTLEGGYFAGAAGFGGALSTATARVDAIEQDPRRKGQALGQQLTAKVAQPRLVLVFFDPLAGAEVTGFLAGLHEAVRCPVAGGAASQPWGPMVATYQYADAAVFSHGAVALALAGPLEVEFGASHGTEPVGIEHTVTRADANHVVEFDGRPAVNVWKETLGTTITDVTQMATLALGLPNEQDPELGNYRVLSPTRVDPLTGRITFFSAVPEGTEVVLHARTRAGVLEGTREMGRELAHRLAGREVKAVLGFECGARTEPFLGRESTRAENRELQAAVAPGAEWLGMMAWGEVLPLSSGPVVVNYTFPVVCLVQA